MMQVMWSLIGFIIAIGILVTFHEFGHFWVARLLGVKVLRFSVGFGKALWKRVDKKGTEYVIAMIPLGGYVKMLDENEGEVAADNLPFAFNRKPVWARMLIVLAGPAFNFIFAIFAYWLFYSIGTMVIMPIVGEVQAQSIVANAGLQNGDVILKVDNIPVHDWNDINFALIPNLGEKGKLLITYKPLNGSASKTATLNLANWKVNQSAPDLLGSLGFTPYYPTVPAVVAKVFPETPAAKAGLKENDTIIKLADIPIKNWEQMTTVLNANINKTVPIEVLRKSKKIIFSLIPAAKKGSDGLLQAKIGIQSVSVAWPKSMIHKVRYSFFSAGAHAINSTWQMTRLTFQMLYKMIIGQVSIRSISGPIGIAKIAGYSAQQGFNVYLSFLALISISLGVINILPIPMLDGGHFLYFIIEAIRGKPLSINSQMVGIRIGLIFLFGLMILALFNDVSRLFN